MFALRWAVPEEAWVIAELFKQELPQSAVDYGIYGSPRLAAYIEDSIRRRSEYGKGEAWFAVVSELGGREVVGTCALVNKGNSVLLSGIATRARYRGLGLGAKLLSASIDVAGLTGAGDISLDVSVSNDLALQWYRRCGFIEVSKKFWCLAGNKAGRATSATTVGLHECGRSCEQFGFGKFWVEIEGDLIEVGMLNEGLFRVEDSLLSRRLLQTNLLYKIDQRRQILLITYDDRYACEKNWPKLMETVRMNVPVDVLCEKLPIGAASRLSGTNV